MDNARKDYLGKKFLLVSDFDIEELKNIEIQELNFLIFSAKYFEREQPGFIKDVDKKVEIFLGELANKIKNAKAIYYAKDGALKSPYIDGENKVWIFSKEKYALEAEDFYLQQGTSLDIEKVENKNIIELFVNFHRLGIEDVLVDNGKYTVSIKRDRVLPPPDWSKTNYINIPVENPKLQFTITKFFQNMYSRQNFEGKDVLLRNLEGNMLNEVINAKYLLPMQVGGEMKSKGEGKIVLEKDTTFSIPSLVTSDDKRWLPAFTDWVEFQKVYDKSLWSGNIVSYEDLISMSKDLEGIVINSHGIPLSINEANRKLIEDFKKEIEKSKEGIVKEEVVKKNTKLIIRDIKDYPEEMVKEFKKYMKKDKNIKSAYLKLMVKNEEQSYLLIVDFKGDNSFFKDLGRISNPYLKGMFIDMVPLDDWAKDVVKDSEPFYIKKILGLF